MLAGPVQQPNSASAAVLMQGWQQRVVAGRAVPCIMSGARGVEFACSDPYAMDSG